MDKIHVIVVPETEDFKLDVSHRAIVWINKNLGVPKLQDKNVLYLAPYWITAEFQGVNRLYHISSHYRCDDGTYEIILGNSFVVEDWDKAGQSRRYEYHDLDSFDMEQIAEGLLRPKADD